MKNIALALACLAAFACGSSAQKSGGATSETAPAKEENTKSNEENKKDNKMKKTLILFYSRPGNNYVGGNIVYLEKGNCLVVAEKIRSLTGADMFQIEPVKEYSEDYMTCTEEAKRELSQNARPAYKGDIDISSYDTIILGYPIWWGTFPMPVFTFLENHDFTGKTIIPFSTHEGSGLGSSVSDIRKLCPGATVKDGTAIRGGSAARSDAEVKRIVEAI